MSTFAPNMVSLLWTTKDRANLISNIARYESSSRDRVGFSKCRIAILSGSTTSLVSRLLKLFLLDRGVDAEIFEGNFGNYIIDSMSPSDELNAFKPDIIYLHTSRVNLKIFRVSRDFAADNEKFSVIDQELELLTSAWKSLSEKFDCWIIQNNFDLPPHQSLGNAELTDVIGWNFVISELNQRLVAESRTFDNVVVNDINALSATVGLEEWWSPRDWIKHGFAISVISHTRLSFNLSTIIGTILGESKKCLIIDFDNTLWGGVVGELGVGAIELGPNSDRGKAFYDFQITIKDLQSRGVILAGCTKNDIDSALSGLSHPSSILSVDDFATIEASWDPKPIAVQRILETVNLKGSNVVFADDSEVEIASVKLAFPEIETLFLDSTYPERYSNLLLRPRYFETLKVTSDDANRKKTKFIKRPSRSYSSREFDQIKLLESLNGKLSISTPSINQLDRVIQLINKTNQFNLNGLRRSPNEIKKFLESKECCLLICEFKDDLADYGIIATIGGTFESDCLTIDIWVMSCRVFDRYIEIALISQLKQILMTRTVRFLKMRVKKTGRNSYFLQTGLRLGLSGDASFDECWLISVDSIPTFDSLPIKVDFK